ncbi:MAG: SDR family oxidoreductase [Desulfosalsimonadaceae bacterium]
MELDGKVALVLGSIKGIGKGVGLALAREGVKIAATYYDWTEELGRMKKDFAGTGREHLLISVDLRDTQQIGPMVRRVAEHFGRLDILVNNIERGGWPVVHGSYTPSQWDLELETTLRAKQWVFDAALPYLKAAGDSCVINFSSVAALVGRSGPASYVFNEGYSAANRGVSLFTETWARLGAPEVRVNEIMLGLFETRHGEKTRGWGLLDTQKRQALIDHTLLGRTGKVDDVIRAVLFLLRDASYMTGSVLRIDGGYVLGGETVAPMPGGVE